jgi:hypothetical protein
LCRSFLMAAMFLTFSGRISVPAIEMP